MLSFYFVFLFSVKATRAVPGGSSYAFHRIWMWLTESLLAFLFAVISALSDKISAVAKKRAIPQLNK